MPARRRSSASMLLALALALGCGDEPKGSTPNAADDPPRPRTSERAGACDVDDVELLASLLDDAAPEARPDLVGKRLPDACEAPAFITHYLAAMAPMPLDQSMPITLGPREQLLQATLRACPDGEEVFRDVANARAKDRAAIEYDGCDYARYDLVGRDEFIAHPFTRGPWLAHQWLLDQGIERAQAEPIFRALVLYDHRGMTPLRLPAGTRLPTVEGEVEPLPDGPTVIVGPGTLELDDRTIAGLEDGALPPAVVREHLVLPLYDRFAEEVDARKMLADSMGEDWNATAIIAAHGDTPYATVMDVLYTLARAEVRSWALAVQSGPFDYGAVPLGHSPAIGSVRAAEWAPPLLVGIDDAGFLVVDTEAGTTAGARLGKLHTKGEPRYDFVGLERRATEYRREHPGARRALVSPDFEVPYSLVVSTIVAIRGPHCEPDTECGLPEVMLVAPGEVRVAPEPAPRPTLRDPTARPRGG